MRLVMWRVLPPSSPHSSRRPFPFPTFMIYGGARIYAMAGVFVLFHFLVWFLFSFGPMGIHQDCLGSGDPTFFFLFMVVFTLQFLAHALLISFYDMIDMIDNEA